MCFWTLSIVLYSKEHNVSETGSTSVFRKSVGGQLLSWVRSITEPHWNAPLNMRMKTDPVSETSFPLEYGMMDKIQNAVDS
jgi:hypothetical protein